MIYVAVDYSPRLSRGEQNLLQLPNRLAQLRPLMRRGVAPRVNRMLLRHWESKGAAFGHRWAPWAASTLRKRRRKGNEGKGILRDTDHLFKAVFRERTTDNRLRAIKGGLKLSLDIRVPRALYHQVGTMHMPERQVIPDPLPRPFKTEIRGVVRLYILTGRIDND